jgi:hypothetical protein
MSQVFIEIEIKKNRAGINQWIPVLLHCESYIFWLNTVAFESQLVLKQVCLPVMPCFYAMNFICWMKIMKIIQRPRFGIVLITKSCIVLDVGFTCCKSYIVDFTWRKSITFWKSLLLYLTNIWCPLVSIDSQSEPGKFIDLLQVHLILQTNAFQTSHPIQQSLKQTHYAAGLRVTLKFYWIH